MPSPAQPPPNDAAYCFLTLDNLRQANRHRLPTFRNRQGHLSHTKPDGSDWSLADWYGAFVGELGEVIGEPSGDGYRDRLAAELADATIYLDLVAAAAGTTLTAGVLTQINKPDMDTVFFGDLCFHLKPVHPWNTLDADIGAALRMGDIIKKYRRGDFQGSAQPDILLRPYIGAALMGLTRIADRSGIDLPSAIVDKFNATSERVGSPITLCFDHTSRWFVFDARAWVEAGPDADEAGDIPPAHDPDAAYVGAQPAEYPADGRDPEGAP